MRDCTETANLEGEKYTRAKSRVKELKGFYVHLVIYILMNTLITIINIFDNMYNNESTFYEAFWNLENFTVWFFWGIGVAIHGFNTFGLSLLFGKNWEARKIEEFIEKEERYKSNTL